VLVHLTAAVRPGLGEGDVDRAEEGARSEDSRSYPKALRGRKAFIAEIAREHLGGNEARRGAGRFYLLSEKERESRRTIPIRFHHRGKT